MRNDNYRMALIATWCVIVAVPLVALFEGEGSAAMAAVVFGLFILAGLHRIKPEG